MRFSSSAAVAGGADNIASTPRIASSRLSAALSLSPARHLPDWRRRRSRSAQSRVFKSVRLAQTSSTSAAVLLGSVINSALDGLKESGGAAVGAAGIVLDAWSWMLGAYAEGQDALVSGVRDCLDAVPLVGASGLGTWASGKLESAIEGVGLQPAEIGALKAVLVNSGHVASKGAGSFASGYVTVKKRVIAYPASSTDLFSSVLTSAEAAAVQSVEDMAGSVEIASIELLGEGGPAVPVTIPLPAAATSFAVTGIHNLFGRLRSFYVETTGVRTWE